jgi:hypothetical protein
MIEAAEEEFKQAETPPYPMPRFYEQFFSAPLPRRDTEGLMDLHAARIGDYSIRNCG